MYPASIQLHSEVCVCEIESEYQESWLIITRLLSQPSVLVTLLLATAHLQAY